jgi:hypothetical protein
LELGGKFNDRTHNRQTNQTSLFETQIVNGWTRKTIEGLLDPWNMSQLQATITDKKLLAIQ